MSDIYAAPDTVPGAQRVPAFPDTSHPHPFYPFVTFQQGRECIQCPLPEEDAIHKMDRYQPWRITVRIKGPHHQVFHVGGRSEEHGPEGEHIATALKGYDGTWSIMPTRSSAFTDGFTTRRHAIDFVLTHALNGPIGNLEPSHFQFSADGKDWHDGQQDEDRYYRWITLGIPHPLPSERAARTDTDENEAS